MPEEPMVVRDLSGVGHAGVRPRAGFASEPSRRPEPRPSAPGPFRLTTAADLAGGANAAPGPDRLSTADLEALKPGVSVIHPEYGLGRIVSVEGAGINRKGRVAFAVGPQRTFILSRSPLRPVGRTVPDGPTARRIADGRS
jgi:DNA helicase-2/ATP-dependent DNA helicase PcrA